MKPLPSTSTSTSTTSSKHSSKSKRFIISCVFFICFLCSLASINEMRFDHLLKFSNMIAFSKTTPSNNFILYNYSSLQSSLPLSLRSIKSSSSSSSSNNDEIRILVGILTLPDNYHKRHFLRMIYGTQSPEGARVDLKFVFCNLTKDDQKVLVALESMHYDDIIILDCVENMDKGKTYTYFSSLPKILSNDDEGRSPNPPYHYVFKADDDTYFRLDHLVKSIRPLPREDLYYGSLIPCRSTDPFDRYMSGMGYMVSWDVVEWISQSDIPKAHLEGPEDQVFEEWLRTGNRGINRYTPNIPKWSMYNIPGVPPNWCIHELWPDTIAVHNLKSQVKWIKTLEYFNVTKNLKPSKLYHIP